MSVGVHDVAVVRATQPASYVPAAPLFASPWPPFRCVCFPEPAGGRQPRPRSCSTAFTNWRNRPTVTRYLSRRKPLTVAGSASPVGPPPVFVYVR